MLYEVITYLEQNPFNVEALNLCAIAASKEGEDDNALLLFRKALKIEPQNGAVHHNFAALLERLGRHEEALEHIRFALNQQPDFPVV